ncbi:acyl-CoA reductase-like NAD-dependent aldehyde dehydrogenase [Altererythrobacter atlanticus]|uniref:Phenylacetaldehyde dehydrogenase n=1 Tax=Croceibacterium atlanticum TaxID=1267766 RepID=A0A0F7KSI7_9SPHN|nr:aldehyde dehydrogenase family protein [Croceibacterium atlanticum]AKH42237.1 Phenylacetaldehyde dehydrogenase [Croceibacterium atlanticum]MBB5731013.1 acyl-CoA reductase-like NAD-dependent aldehyde dehydrogenase [Croceibacterium atlanticum]
MTGPFSPESLDKLRASLGARPRQLFIGGEFVSAQSGKTFDVVDPASGETFASAASGEAADIDAAVNAARAAFPQWAATPPAARADMLLKLADLIEREGERIALTETLDNGMPFMMAKFAGVMGAAGQLRYNAGWATKIAGETLTPSAPGEWHAFTLREPVGVVGAIVPWNFPFVMAVSKIAPALAAGCTVVLKPAEQTPLTAVILAELLQEAGFPAGVVNVVTGYGETAGAALAAHPGVDKISFTGSTQVGKSIVRASTGNLKRVSLELGGKSPVVIFEDADLEKAIPAAAAGIFGNSGQVCAAGSRLFVHEKIADRVIEGIADRARSLKVGPGLAAGTEMGPLVSNEQLERVMGYIESGAGEGAEIAAGGKRIDGEGYFVQPTVLTGTAAGMKVVDEEIFGPVLCAMRFGDDDIERIASQANAGEYGLSSAIWTRDISNALRLAKRLQAGTVRINGGAGVDPAMPLGGYKQSGWGRENGRAGVEAYTELKAVTVAL